MSAPIDFYFDFSSPYAYLASRMIGPVAEKHGREVNWHSFMLGAAFKGEKTMPLTMYPKKGAYSRLDFDRTARKHGIPFNMPVDFPKVTLHASRVFFWLSQKDKAAAQAFGEAVFAAYFVNGRDISDASVILDIAEEANLVRRDVEAVMQDAAIKEAYKASVDDIVDGKEIFGAPYFVVDGEPFWGADRVGQIDEWLQTGGW